MRTTKGFAAVAAILAVSVAATSAYGVTASLVSIGALSPGDDGTVMSKIYAISPDGLYAVGESNGMDATGSIPMAHAILYSTASSTLLELPNSAVDPDPQLDSSARGVVVLANGNVLVGGYMSDPGFPPYRMGTYQASQSDLTGGTWALSPGTHNTIVGTYNAVRAYEDGSGNNWSIVGRRAFTPRTVFATSTGYSDSGALAGYDLRVFNAASRVVQGSQRGYAAGYERETATGRHRAMFGSSINAAPIPGSAGWQSEALGISPETTTVAGSGLIVGYDQDASDDHLPHAFKYAPGSAGMVLLNELAGTNQSQAIDVRVFNGGSIIGGFCSNGFVETAVLWDSTGTWSYSGKARSVAGLLTNIGVDISAWSSLSRVTSMSDDGTTIAGWGIWAEDGSTRGFIATVPEPTTMFLLVLGGLAMLRRRR